MELQNKINTLQLLVDTISEISYSLQKSSTLFPHVVGTRYTWIFSEQHALVMVGLNSSY